MLTFSQVPIVFTCTQKWISTCKALKKSEGCIAHSLKSSSTTNILWLSNIVDAPFNFNWCCNYDVDASFDWHVAILLFFLMEFNLIILSSAIATFSLATGSSFTFCSPLKIQKMFKENRVVINVVLSNVLFTLICILSRGFFVGSQSKGHISFWIAQLWFLLHF